MQRLRCGCVTYVVVDTVCDAVDLVAPQADSGPGAVLGIVVPVEEEEERK